MGVHLYLRKQKKLVESTRTAYQLWYNGLGGMSMAYGIKGTLPTIEEIETELNEQKSE